MSRLRAIETGRTVLQVSTTGVSAIIAPGRRGRTRVRRTVRPGAAERGRRRSRPRTTPAVAARRGARSGCWPALAVLAAGAAVAVGVDRAQPGRTRRRQEVVHRMTSRPGHHPDLQREREHRARSSSGCSRRCPRRTCWSPTTPARTAPARSPTRLAEADPRVHVLHRPGKAGLGAAYVAGFDWGLARGYDVLVEMDADGSHAPEQLPRLLAALDARRPRARVALGARRRGRELAAAARGALARRQPLRPPRAGHRAARRHRRLPRLPARRARGHRLRGGQLAGLLLPGRPGLARAAGGVSGSSRCRSPSPSASAASRR